MSCNVSNMNIIRRDDTAFELTFTDVDGAPIDLTNGTVFFTAKRKITDDDADAMIEKEITVFADPTTGIATLILTKTDTNIPAGSYVFDIQFKAVDGKIASSSAGKLFVSQDVTVRTS